MAIELLNVLTGTKEPLRLVREGEVNVYVCGVTVYGRCHVGHLRCYLSFDIVLRYLAYRGLKVNFARNFTDIDDKIIARAREIAAGADGQWKKGEAFASYDDCQWQQRLAEDDHIRVLAAGQSRHLAEIVADHFIDAFYEDFAPFDLLPATVEPRVSTHIAEVISLIEQIIGRGFAYEIDGDVYFDVPAYHKATGAYGKLSRRDYTQMMDGARVSPTDRKRSGVDFALWKKAAPGEPAWDSPWGKGRPGWHIECSAMSTRHLGQPFDIHGGGKDLIFPHHENEIAQSEAGSGKPYCHAWMHNGFVTVDGVKMSKSLGNFISIKDALKLAPPEVWRLLVLSNHYASPIDFSRTKAEDCSCGSVRGSIDIAFDRLAYFYETLARADEMLGSATLDETSPLLSDPRVCRTLGAFCAAMDDDFNSALALAELGDAMKLVNELVDMKPKDAKKLPGGDSARIASVRHVVGQLREAFAALNLLQRDPVQALSELRSFAAQCRNIDKSMVEKKIAQRLEARAQKDWALSDAIRDELKACGVELRDSATGTTWKVNR
ncbi:MAG: cysteine--tRNA ligase [Myxococcota bacterium]|jgi:cysteinyl-tRNA synthetase|nr:cysteine--tRNA ligase [Myxococcota bacterium]